MTIAICANPAPAVKLARHSFRAIALEARFVPDVRTVAKYIPNVQLGQIQYSGAFSPDCRTCAPRPRIHRSHRACAR